MTANYPLVALPESLFAAEVQAFCLAFPGAYEDYPWGEVVYKVGANKMFAMLSGRPGLQVTVKATPDDAAILTQFPNIAKASYVGRWGWVTITVEDEATLAVVSTGGFEFAAFSSEVLNGLSQGETQESRFDSITASS